MASGRSNDFGTGETVSTGGLERGDANAGDLATGTMVGEYRVEGLLGEGGMGRVYSAIHPVIAKRAAIKILHPQLSVNREAVERFVQEARAVNQIGHPNIVDIFSFGTLADGRSYFVMEWLRGQSLRDRIRTRGLTIAESLSVIETIAIALEAAHETGIVHRDLKPDNVFLVEVKGAPPTVKLLDFGIAKLLGNHDGSRIEKTATGNLLGTPAYISPEQARGQDVDHRTDIYALGALLYELVTARLLFPAGSAADMIAMHLYEQPPDAHQVNPGVPPELAQLIRAMVAKDASVRPTLAQVREALTPLRGGAFALPIGSGFAPMYTPSRPSSPALLTPPPPTSTSTTGTAATAMATHLPAPRRSRAPLIVALLVALAAAAVVIVYVTRTPASAPQQPAVAPPVDAAPVVDIDAAVVVPPPDAEPVSAPPDAAPEPVDAGVPDAPKQRGKKPRGNGTKPTPTTTKPDVPFDPDAPM